MTVDSVTSASPSFAEQGSQVNLWVVGTGFASGAEVSFNIPGIEPALVDGNAIPPKVFLNVESEGGSADGIQYFVRIAPPPEAPPGFVDITVTNPDGTRATGRQLMEIVAPGSLPEVRPGEQNIDSITGASPRAAFIGQRVALWLWGKGIAETATVTFDNPAVSTFRQSEVVPNSASHPGFAGVRNYLYGDPAAQPGPVGVTIRNPNGTQVTVPNLFQLLEGGGTPGNGGMQGGPANCPDQITSIAGITRVTPLVLERGKTQVVTIEGLAFACGAQVLISGGGLRAIGTPDLYRTPLNPFDTTLTWEIEVGYEAELGERDVTIINPNNTSKTAGSAIRIIDGTADGEASFGCHQLPGKGSDRGEYLWAVLIALVGVRWAVGGRRL
jgi:hypothetical protein